MIESINDVWEMLRILDDHDQEMLRGHADNGEDKKDDEYKRGPWTGRHI